MIAFATDFAELTTGATLHYIDTNPNSDKTPVILLHGMLGTAEMNFPTMIEWLRSDYRVIGPTLRGYGKSKPQPRVFPYDFYQRDSQDVLAFMNALNIEKAHILGYSDGGEVALLASAAAPERFHSVAVWGAVGYFGPAMRPVIQRYYPGEWITEDERRIHNITNPAAFVLGWVQAVKRIIDSGGDLSLSQADKITAPLLLMLGVDDTLNPVAYGQRFIERTPNGHLKTFACGHAIHDAQWDAFKTTVGEFLQSVI